MDLITGNPSAEVPYNGKDILIYNNKAGNLTLKHDGSGTADVKFLLENGVDLVVAYRELMDFRKKHDPFTARHKERYENIFRFQTFVFSGRRRVKRSPNCW